MLSYQHAYHAGGAADVHKHAALAALLALLTVKPRAITYLETHAGRGLYDLGGPEAEKTGEARAGALALEPAPGPWAEALAATRAAHGPNAYPGSPLIAEALLRPGDRRILCELHPAEHDALRRAARGAEIHRRDGHEAAIALSPPTPRRGLVLIDPSYEVKDEYARTAATARAILRKWPEAVIAIWYPILTTPRHAALLDGLAGAAPMIREVAFASPPARGMTGSGLALLNAPWGAEAALEDAETACAPILRPARA